MRSPAADRPVDTRVELETPEHVAFHHRAAGPGVRGAAWLVDAMLRLILLIVAGTMVAMAFGVAGLAEPGMGAMLVVWFAMDWGWFTVWEGAAGGQSPGKMALGLRVLRADGAPIGWREAWLRNLLRAADSLPLFYVVGVVAMAVDARFRRLGDLLAGTVVVHEPPRAVPFLPPAVKPPPTPEEEATLPARVSLTPAIHLALERWQAARTHMSPAWSAAVAARVVEPLQERTGITAPTAERSLELALWAARRTEEDAQRGMRAREADWRALGQLLDEVQRNGLPPSRVPELLARYRDICSDLGRMRGAVVAPDHLASLEQLCARAHTVVYRTLPRSPRAARWRIADFLFVDLPAEVRASRRWIAFAALLFLGPMFLGFVLGAAQPEFTEAVLPASTRGQMIESYRESVPREGGQDALMAGFYVWNNVGIALRSVAAGVFAGVGSGWVLLYNGLIIGTVAGFLTSLGYGMNLLRFTMGHSAWELTALIIAGAAGMRLGWSFVAPGPHTRLTSLRLTGPAVARLSACAAVMLVVAAGIEGFWSALDLPTPVKVTFALAQAVIVTRWLAGPPLLRSRA